MDTSPNLLSQQIVSWLLQAAGLLAAHRNGDHALRRVSPSTVKSALRREPVPRSWDPLVDELIVLFGARPTPDQRAGLGAMLRAWDRDVSRLDTCGLPPAELLPAVLHVLGPAIGIRFGALAALEQLQPSTTERPVSDWLCDPLAPDTFGHVVDWLFVRHHPHRAHWSERYPILPGIDRTSVDDWRSPTLLRVPNASNLGIIARAMGRENETRALAVLRVARVLAAGRELIASTGGQLLADEFASMVASYARVTRVALTAPGVVADLAELLYATALESPLGAAVLANLDPLVGWGVDEAPTAVAQRIRSAAGRARVSGDLTELRWVLVVTLVLPTPEFVGGLGTQLGDSEAGRRACVPPLELLRSAWSMNHFLSLLSRGEPIAYATAQPGPEVLQRPSPTLQEWARDALDEQRRLVRRPGDPPPKPLLFERVFFGLAAELGGERALHETVAALNARALPAAVPRFVEPALDDAHIAELPHLMPERARSLALRGEDNEAMGWITRWATSDAPRSPDERRAVAETTLAIAHRLLDRGRPARALLDLDLPAPLASLPEELRQRIGEAAEQAQRALSTLLRSGDQLLELATAIAPTHPGSPEEVDALVRALPLALRLDFLAAAATGDEAYLTRSEGLAARLVAPDRALPDHGPAWAMRAVWHLVLGEDPALAVKRATHFGSLSVYEAEVARLVADHALPQDPR